MSAPEPVGDTQRPLGSLDAWEDFVKARYPVDEAASALADRRKQEEQFRDYAADARPSVREFYRLNHRHQTIDFVRQKKREYLSLSKRRMAVWEAMQFLNTLVDDSDPDTD